MLKKYVRSLLLNILKTKNSLPIFLKVANNLFSLPTYSTHKRFSKIYNKITLQGILNNKIIPYHLTRVWPFWIYKQLNPESSSYSSAGFPFALINNTHRNWTSISSPESDQNAIVDPRGLITLVPNGWSLDFWIAQSSVLYSPSRLKNVEQTLIQDKSIVSTKFTINDINVNSEVFLKPNNNKSLVFNQIKIKNSSDEPKIFSFFLSVRPYNPEGLSPIDEIVYLTSNSLIIDGHLSAIFDQKPDNIVCLKFEDGDVSEHFNNWEMILQAKCKNHLASAFAEYRLSLDPNEEKVISCKLLPNTTSKLLRFLQKQLPKSKKTKLLKETAILQSIKYENEKENYLEYWDKALNPLCKISIPDKKLEKCFQQNLIHLQNFIGKNNIYPGSFTYKDLWTKDSATAVLALNRIGAFDLSKKSIEFLLQTKPSLKINNPYNTKGELDIFGQLIYIIYDYYNFSQDKSFLEFYFPNIKLLIEKIQQLQVKQTSSQPELIGLMQKSYTCNNSGCLDHYMRDNFWTLAGIKYAKQIAKVLDKEDLLEHLSSLETKLAKHIETFISHISTLRKSNPFIPISPSRFLDSGLITALVGVYPLNIMDPQAEIVTNTIHLLEKYFLTNNIYFNHLDHPGYNIASNCQLAQTYLYRQDTKAFNIIDWLTTNTTSTGAWPEALHPHSKGGCAGDGHDTLATAEFLILVRNMLVKEEGQSLHITPIFPKEWLNNKKPIQVKDLPSYFGKINFTMSFSENTVHLDMNNEYSLQPTTLKVSLPQPIKSLEIDNQEAKDIYKSVVHLPPNTKKAKLTLLTE
jgi:GH15 family glucan-1,4-alpha-glucosidase